MLPQRLKDAATAAFRDNARRALLTPTEREEAAAWYDRVSQRMLGTKAGLAELDNRERARFLCGEVPRLASTANEFAAEIGWSPDAPL